MREILFRGKANSEIREGEWVYGSLLVETESTFPIIARDYDNDEDWLGVDLWDTVEPHTVGQYTGLTDKNGKKIFEGDIIKADNWLHQNMKVYTVVFEDGGFYAKYKDEDGWNFDHLGNIEVIGNIHDNPELIKEV